MIVWLSCKKGGDDVPKASGVAGKKQTRSCIMMTEIKPLVGYFIVGTRENCITSIIIHSKYISPLLTAWNPPANSS